MKALKVKSFSSWLLWRSPKVLYIRYRDLNGFKNQRNSSIFHGGGERSKILTAFWRILDVSRFLFTKIRTFWAIQKYLWAISHVFSILNTRTMKIVRERIGRRLITDEIRLPLGNPIPTWFYARVGIEIHPLWRSVQIGFFLNTWMSETLDIGRKSFHFPE